MKKAAILLAALLPVFSFGQGAANLFEFKNGQIWDGEKFAPASFWVSGKQVSTKKSAAEPTRVFDLTGQFVVPPVGDAGSLSFDGAENLEFVLKSCLSEGLFYVAQTGNSQAGRAAVSEKVNQPLGPDVSFANGVVTCTNGEPSNDIETRAYRAKFPREWQKKLETARQNPLLFSDAYWFVDSEEMLKINWPRITAMKPDFIQISLRDVSMPARHGGLSPEIAKKVVKKAHKAGLRVFASIETAADFRAGLDAGVDVFSNLPGHVWDGKGSPDKFLLTEKDWNKAKKKKVAVVSTFARTALLTGGMDKNGRFVSDSAQVRAVRGLYKSHLQNCLDRGIPFALGSDEWGKTSRTELNFLFQTGFATPTQMLMMQTAWTPKTIFPKRKIGKIGDGFEASFLVLEGDPTKNVLNIRRILMKFKDGQLLPSEEAKK